MAQSGQAPQAAAKLHLMRNLQSFLQTCPSRAEGMESTCRCLLVLPFWAIDGLLVLVSSHEEDARDNKQVGMAPAGNAGNL